MLQAEGPEKAASYARPEEPPAPSAPAPEPTVVEREEETHTERDDRGLISRITRKVVETFRGKGQ